MKLVVLPMAFALFLLSSCKKDDTRAQKEVHWPKVEQALKLYAEEKGGLFCQKGQSSWHGSLVRSSCELLVPCKEHSSGIPELMEEIMQEVIEASVETKASSAGVDCDHFLSKAAKNGIYLRVDTGEKESWFTLGNDHRWNVHIRGRIIYEDETKDISGSRLYKTLKGGKRPKGAMFWLKINYINQNPAKAKD